MFEYVKALTEISRCGLIYSNNCFTKLQGVVMISELTAILIAAPVELMLVLYYWRRNEKELNLLKEQINSNLLHNYVDITSDGSFIFSNGNKYSFDMIIYRIKAIKLIKNSGKYYIAKVHGYQPRRILKHIPNLV